ncbi:permease prefix domain 1-containing protein [Agromyces sp. GXS1127]|uniref:permease prefix domain 1-containing protein n=1 Tax=Agromyces sp. GXS1127 TaxID=3424181 RepID=UPI003D319A43
MTTPAATLTDRYVWAAVRTVPDAQRADLDRELRERIGDASDALVGTGRTPADAERMALVELGDPAALAAGYVDRPLQLIGPSYFLTWWRLVKMLYAIVLPIAAGAVLLAKMVSQAPIGEAFADAFSVAFALAVHLGFWPTLVFAILERSPGRAPDLTWNPEMLPDLPETGRRGRLGDLIASLVFLGLFAILIIWQGYGAPIERPMGEAVPVLSPDLWSFWIPWFLVIIGLEMVFAAAIYAWGWNWWLAVVNLLLNIAFAVPALWLFTTGQLFNPVFLEVIGWPWGEAGSVVTTIIVFVFVAVSIWDVVDGVIKTVRGRGGSALTLGRI